MKRIRGFRLRTKLVKAFKWVVHGRTKRASSRRLSYQNSAIKAMSKLCNWGRSLKHGAKLLCSSNTNSGYSRVGQDLIDAKPVGVPKGHMAVYVGEKEDETHRFFVPVVYFNHPLFGDLLREAEKVYGFNHCGGIQIPCRISEFERVRTRVAGGGGSGGGDYCPGWRS
ncbi:auxin-responsive protein SAUR36-like [Cornus florida]|uniref:auxin-responsive protein SAUR36-like n=1 Tax=Cornus florida TaxID=4283 RepID=UPI0028A11BDB|nr:auxin-responsive protein SAUR36-like [Cornus florida]